MLYSVDLDRILVRPHEQSSGYRMYGAQRAALHTHAKASDHTLYSLRSFRFD